MINVDETLEQSGPTSVLRDFGVLAGVDDVELFGLLVLSELMRLSTLPFNMMPSFVEKELGLNSDMKIRQKLRGAFSPLLGELEQF